jgi:hypothetical protein
MTSKDNAQDEELLARYRRASDTDAAAPSESVRSAILAESRRVADELAKKAPQPQFDVSRPAANDARWKITAYGTVGAALLAVLLITPRFWESRRATEISSVPAVAPAKPEESLQEVIVTQAKHTAAATRAEESRQYAAPAPSAPPSAPPNVAENFARAPASPPVADAAPPSPPVSTSTAPPAAPAPLAYSAGAARGDALSGGALFKNSDRAARTNLVQTPASLQAAAGLGDVRQTALLLDQGVAVDARDEAGRTPLMLAVAQGRLEVVRLLLARGADANAADNFGRTPLQQAREKNLRDVAALLERAGAH